MRTRIPVLKMVGWWESWLNNQNGLAGSEAVSAAVGEMRLLVEVDCSQLDRDFGVVQAARADCVG